MTPNGGFSFPKSFFTDGYFNQMTTVQSWVGGLHQSKQTSLLALICLPLDAFCYLVVKNIPVAKEKKIFRVHIVPKCFLQICYCVMKPYLTIFCHLSCIQELLTVCQKKIIMLFLLCSKIHVFMLQYLPVKSFQGTYLW